VEDGQHRRFRLPCGGGRYEQDVLSLKYLGYQSSLGLGGVLEAFFVYEPPDWAAQLREDVVPCQSVGNLLRGMKYKEYQPRLTRKRF